MTNPEYKYIKQIEKIINHLQEVLKKKGNYENFGEKELRLFKDKLSQDSSLSYSERISLETLLDERIQEIQ